MIIVAYGYPLFKKEWLDLLKPDKVRLAVKLGKEVVVTEFFLFTSGKMFCSLWFVVALGTAYHIVWQK